MDRQLAFLNILLCRQGHQDSLYIMIGRAQRRAVVVCLAAITASLVLVHVTAAADSESTEQVAEPSSTVSPILDSVRYKSMFLRYYERLAQLEAQRLAELKAAREARQLARKRAAKKKARQQALKEAKAVRATGGLIVGDSVSMGAESCLITDGYRLDSSVGRPFAEGLQRLKVQQANGLPETVVIHLGTNGPFSLDGFRSAMSLVQAQERVVWVTIALPDKAQYQFRDSMNDLIRAAAADYDNVRVADFGAAAEQHPEWFHSDGVHINSAGCRGFTDIVNDAVSAPTR